MCSYLRSLTFTFLPSYMYFKLAALLIGPFILLFIEAINIAKSCLLYIELESFILSIIKFIIISIDFLASFACFFLPKKSLSLIAAKEVSGSSSKLTLIPPIVCLLFTWPEEVNSMFSKPFICLITLSTKSLVFSKTW